MTSLFLLFFKKKAKKYIINKGRVIRDVELRINYIEKRSFHYGATPRHSY